MNAKPFGSNFKAGDTIVAYVGTSELLDGTISIKSLLDRELAAGTTTFSFAVDREGEIALEVDVELFDRQLVAVQLDSDAVRDYRPILTYSAGNSWTHGYARPQRNIFSAPVRVASL